MAARTRGTPPPPEPASGASPRAGRKAETQARIVEAAAGLFAARGYERTSIAAVAERAHVSRSAVFWHFGDKQGLFREAFRRLLVPFVEQMHESLESIEPRERLAQMIQLYDGFVRSQSETIQSMVRWALESPALRTALRDPLFSLHDQFLGDVRRAMAELLADPEQAPALAAGFVSMLHGNLVLSFLDPDPRKERLRSEGVERWLALALPAPDES